MWLNVPIHLWWCDGAEIGCGGAEIVLRCNASFEPTAVLIELCELPDVFSANEFRKRNLVQWSCILLSHTSKESVLQQP